MTVVAVIGAATLLLAGCSALVQTDIKRVLAYSTISQIGYMFLGLGVGAWSAAVFHLMTHAFFKALLFLGAGAVIISLHHEQDIFKMGGLRRRLPAGLLDLPHRLRVAGGAAAGHRRVLQQGPDPVGRMGLIGRRARGCGRREPLGAFLTAVYSFRLVFIVFFGDEKGHVEHRPGLRILIPLVVLAVLSVIGGFVETPNYLGHVTFFSDLTDAPPAGGRCRSRVMRPSTCSRRWSAGSRSLGVFLAYLLYLKTTRHPGRHQGDARGRLAQPILVVGLGLRHALRPALRPTLRRPRPAAPRRPV